MLTQCECRNHGCKCQHIITAQRQYPKGIVHMWIQLYCFLVISTGKCASTSKPAWIGGMKFCQDCETILQTDAAHVNEPLGLYRTEPWNQKVGGGWKTSTIIKVKIKTKFLYFFFFFCISFSFTFGKARKAHTGYSCNVNKTKEVHLRLKDWKTSDEHNNKDLSHLWYW